MAFALSLVEAIVIAHEASLVMEDNVLTEYLGIQYQQPLKRTITLRYVSPQKI